MRRVLASLLITLMTFALVTRGVAAPLMHLHLDAAPAPVSAPHDEHSHADCAESELSDSDGLGGNAAAHAHGDTDQNESVPFDNGKVCDANGACCGPLVLSEASESVFGLEAAPEPSQPTLGAGVKPTDPGRPPSPPLA